MYWIYPYVLDKSLCIGFILIYIIIIIVYIMDFFSFNYKPGSFKGKTPEAILEMKPNKIDKEFFTKYTNENNESFRELTPEIKGAIQLLIDLKNKVTIYNKCYKNSFSTEKHHSVKPGTPKPLVQEDQYQEQKQEANATPVKMEGGSRRRRNRKGTKAKAKSSNRRSKRGKRTRKH